ncbi:MAG: hypothetical protein R8M14_08210 [Ghiorsea sp.]
MKSYHLRIIHILIGFIFTVLLTSCADWNFNMDLSKQGLLEIGQQSAKQNCKQQMNLNAYQECLNRVNESYGTTY